MSREEFKEIIIIIAIIHVAVVIKGGAEEGGIKNNVME